jgi:hypothetical protein
MPKTRDTGPKSWPLRGRKSGKVERSRAMDRKGDQPKIKVLDRKKKGLDVNGRGLVLMEREDGQERDKGTNQPPNEEKKGTEPPSWCTIQSLCVLEEGGKELEGTT